MALRHLVTGQNNCAPDGASSSNPLNALANAFLGQSSKAQVSLPSASSTVPNVEA
jgi:peroxin-5